MNKATTTFKSYHISKCLGNNILPPCLIRSAFVRSSSSKTTTATTTTSTTIESIPQPTLEQLRVHYFANGLPMVGFGFVDQTVMIQAGNMIDCTFGVTFGLSTLTAAAVGGLISNLSGVIFGGTLENLAKAWGLQSSNLTSQQRNLTFVKRNRLLSQAAGILLGCCLGLLNILFIDTDKSQSLKLLKNSEDEEFAFEVEASNDVRDDATVITVKGPDVDGVLASLTATLTLHKCSLLEVNAHKKSGSVDGFDMIEDVFVIIDQSTKKKLKDEDLEDLCASLLSASREGATLLKYKVKELEEKNQALKSRVQHLEGVLLKRRMSIKPSGKGIVRN